MKLKMTGLKTSFIVCLLFAAFLRTGSFLFAADQFLDTCLQIAEARDKRLAVASEQINLSRVRVTRSARAFFPSLSLERRNSKGIALQNVGSTEQLGYQS